MRPRPRPVEGLSKRADLIHGSERCWPQVVGMRNGTGERAQPITRAEIPTRKTAAAP